MSQVDLTSQTLAPELTPEQRRAIALSEMELMGIVRDEIDEKIVLTEDNFFEIKSQESFELNSEEMLNFLGIPVRRGYVLRRGDLKIINLKFKELLKYYQENTLEGAEQRFFSQMKFRVTNKANLGKAVDNGLGKSIPYAGGYTTGETLSVFISDCKTSRTDMEYIIQAVSMRIIPELLEDLKNQNLALPVLKDRS